MKQLKLFILLAFLVINFKGYCQEVKGEKKIEEKNEASIYTQEQEEYMEKWFADISSEMDLYYEQRLEYNKILIYYTSKMGQLSENENKYSEIELKQELNKLVVEMNSEMATVLSKKNYEKHVDSFELVLWNVYLRKGWD